MGDVIATVASAMWPALVAAIVIEFAKARSNHSRAQDARTRASSRAIRVELTVRLCIVRAIRSDQPKIVGDARKKPSASPSAGVTGVETDG